MSLTVGSLFSGIGGIDLGLERAGMQVIWQSEIDPYASKVLAKHWPNVTNVGDITKIDWSTVERPDVVVGGPPCQPVSAAGKQQAQADKRWLWPEFARCLRHLRPSYVIVENVPALLSVTGGRAAQEVFGDLAALGFDAEWCCLSAAEFGAPHLRKRVFVMAYATGSRDGAVDRGAPGNEEEHGGWAEEDDHQPAGGGPGRGTWTLANPSGEYDRAQVLGGEADRTDPAGPTGRPRGSGRREVEPGLGGGMPDGLPRGLERPVWRGWGSLPGEPQHGWEPPRIALGTPDRTVRLRCLGNAVVPQVAEYIGRILIAHIGDGGSGTDD